MAFSHGVEVRVHRALILDRPFSALDVASDGRGLRFGVRGSRRDALFDRLGRRHAPPEAMVRFVELVQLGNIMRALLLRLRRRLEHGQQRLCSFDRRTGERGARVRQLLLICACALYGREGLKESVKVAVVAFVVDQSLELGVVELAKALVEVDRIEIVQPPTVALHRASMLLATQDTTRLVVDLVDEDDALALALTCRTLRDAVRSLFSQPHPRAPRLRTRTRACACSVTRMAWARACGCPCACRWAAQLGKQEVLEWARAQGCPWHGAVVGASAGGHAELVRWLHEEGCASEPRVLALEAAAEGGHVGVLAELIRQEGYAWSHLVSTAAARGGHVTTLAWLHKRGCPHGPWLMTAAAAGGHMDALRWAHETGCRMGVSDGKPTANAAAGGGHLAVLRWLRGHGCAWDAETSSLLARGGHLDALRWARAEGCPWDSRACAAAAAGGHLDVLRWLRANGCPWGAETCSAAARGGHLHVLQWAREHNCVWDAAALAEATEHGHAHVAAWAHAAGAPDQSVVYEAPALWGGLSAAVQRLMRADESDEDDDGRESEGEASHARAAQLARLIGLASASASRSGAR